MKKHIITAELADILIKFQREENLSDKTMIEFLEEYVRLLKHKGLLKKLKKGK